MRLLLTLVLSLLLTACGAPAQVLPVEDNPPAEELQTPAPVEIPEPGAIPMPEAGTSPAPASESDPASDPESESDPAPAPEPEPGDFVRAAEYVSGVQVDLRYASEDNFTGQVIYDFTEAYLRYGTALKLARAQDVLSEQGYSLLIWDAFRPTEAQFRLWEACPDPVYVANPERGFSSHSRGNTVDVTLVLADGSPAEMPTGFDDFSPMADRDYGDVPETAAANAELLERVMADCGFRPYSGEWWHFSDTDSYPVEEDFVPGK